MTPQMLFVTHSSNFETNDSVSLSPSFLIYLTAPMMSNSFSHYIILCCLYDSVCLFFFPMAAQLLTKAARHDSNVLQASGNDLVIALFA